ncbi:LamG domain-containing protein, partial [bacterium]|nr:LamG domain-containing protein [bacterium]
IHRIFGALIKVQGDYKRFDDQHLQSPQKSHHLFSIYVLSQQPSSPEKWLTDIRELSKRIEAIDFEKRKKEHLKWWEAFWNRSWIFIRDREVPSSAPVVPANPHPFLVGMDQQGGSIFSGEIARVSIIDGILPQEKIVSLAKGNKKPLRGKEVLVSLVKPQPGTKIELKPEELPAFTCEAWIKISENDGGGRILDKITPGGSDGFLLDTYPGKSIRLIVGDRTLSLERALKPGTWHHLAVVIAQDKLQVYLDGKLVLGDINPPGYDVVLGYLLQRFITACAGRGAYPIKFNGSLFVMPWPGCPNDADYRRWGPGYWWQNTRLPYISACTSGDYDIMQPLFNMYAGEVFEVSKFRVRRYFGFEGVYYPECIYPWGAVFMDTYGWEKPASEREDKLQSSRWHKYEWVGGLELVYMMLDYYEHTLDEKFLREKVIPLAYEICLFFNNFYKTGPDGKLIMEPSQALETWWDCRNPMPEIAGLQAITARLLALPEGKLPSHIKDFLREFREKIPPLPLREIDGVMMLAPAERFAQKSNVENPELYAVFPFRLVSFEKPNVELGIQALRHREDRGNFGWRQDDIFMAYLGLAKEAKDYIVGRARAKNPLCRFPAFWGPNYDWTPDQDHGGVLMKALQSMLIQTEGRRIYLFPAWPKEWDVDFKLHAPYRTTIEGKLIGGKLVELKVTPEERRKDITILNPQ